MRDIKHGFIITYFKSTPESEKILTDLIKTVSRMDVYLVLASHSSEVPIELQNLCDFYFYEKLNIIDDRKYSHGVAENSIIKISLNHLKNKNINWTFKCCYDVIIRDINVFNNWIKDYKYDLVSCNWGESMLATHSFFANVNFLLENIKYYSSIEEMFDVASFLEKCWQKDIEDKKLTHKIFSFKDKKELYGQDNEVDILFYNYNKLNFWYSKDENKFFCTNNGNDFKGTIRIFDYYSDLCMYKIDDFEHKSGLTMWFIPPFQDSVKNSKNGWYVEYCNESATTRYNYGIKDFYSKDPMHKAFITFKSCSDMKYHEYSELSQYDLYKNKDFNLDLSSVRNYVDVGANFGLASIYFIKNKIKCYMIDADPYNIEILKNAYSNNSKTKIFFNAVCDTDGQVSFYTEKNASVTSSLFEKNVNDKNISRKKITVPAITPNTLIEKLIDEDYIDLMKIDIEGAEYLFFEKITDENIKKIKNIIIEFHNNYRYEVLGILQKLAKNDFKFKLDNWGSYTNEFIIENKMGIIYAYR